MENGIASQTPGCEIDLTVDFEYCHHQTYFSLEVRNTLNISLRVCQYCDICAAVNTEVRVPA